MRAKGCCRSYRLLLKLQTIFPRLESLEKPKKRLTFKYEGSLPKLQTNFSRLEFPKKPKRRLTFNYVKAKYRCRSYRRTSLDWNLQRSGRSDWDWNTWRRKVAAEVIYVGYTWNKIKILGINTSDWNEFFKALNFS